MDSYEMKLSIVSPVFRAKACVEEVVSKVTESVEPITSS